MKRLAAFVYHLKIADKIRLGYALAVGIAIVGTSTGLAIAEQQRQQATLQIETARANEALFSSLEIEVLQTTTHVHKLTSALNQPIILEKEYIHFQEHAARVEQLWAALIAMTEQQATASRTEVNKAARINQFVEAYRNTPTSYFMQLQPLLNEARQTKLLPEKVKAIRQRLLDFGSDTIADKFHNISDGLNDLHGIVDEEYAAAIVIEERAHRIAIQLTLASMLISAALAALLAWYTSQAIARPVQALNAVAQRVTAESNFELQAVVTSQDEVGALTDSLNQLIQRVKILLEEQKAESDRKLIQSEKMSSLGRMVAGVAHEINNPVNFISGNLEPTRNYIQDLLTLLDAYAAKVSDTEIDALVEAIDLDFLKEDLAKILDSMQVGVDRVRQIVVNLKNFSRLDESTPHSVDLHACLDSTLLILNNRLKRGISIDRQYGDIPSIQGFSGSLYQVFMNILSNAIDAFEENEAEQPVEPKITIKTERTENNWVNISITDNGAGIAPENLQKIFESFFTTKPIGIGTGLGLAISRQIIEEKHSGRLNCESELGKGTTFAIALPLN